MAPACQTVRLQQSIRGRRDVPDQILVLQKPRVRASRQISHAHLHLLTSFFSAYEIEKYWGETPPPKEILEDLTAKGGGLRTRTLENYAKPGSRESLQLLDAQDSNNDEEQSTPRVDRTDPEEPGSGSRYPTRHLRQDPKKTQLFQPDTAPQRARNARSTHSPQPTAHQPMYTSAAADPRNPSFTIQNYEPRQPIALTLRPVITPGNQPDLFFQRKAIEKAQKQPRLPPEPQQFLKHHVPTFGGPNIYQRCLYGLRSGIPEEQAFALHHLVKVSYERGDKYKFEGFPLLAESLIEKALEIMQLVYDVKWEVSYSHAEGTAPDGTLNAAFGTPNLLQRLRKLKQNLADSERSEKGSQHLEKLNEAALVIRNMLTLEDNAILVSKMPLLKDFLVIAISLPPQSRLDEFKHYALEMAEQVTRYYSLQPRDSLYLAMLHHLDSPDRAMVLSALRAINRIGIELETVFRIEDVPASTVERIISLVLLESDDELVEACLDFLYEYTAIWTNTRQILSTHPELYIRFIPRLIALMNHNPTTTKEEILSKPKTQNVQMSAQIPTVPNELLQQLLQFPEPQRSSRWLKVCFEESREDDVTQIAIWQAYQGRFQAHNPIPAAEFIKNVSTTFTTAQAQVINGPQPRFIIKGIKPRRVLLDLQGQPYYKCFWENTRPEPPDASHRSSQRHICPTWSSTRKGIWTHIMTDHLNIQRQTDGQFINRDIGEYRCKWTGCMRSTPFSKPSDIGTHVRAHIPETNMAMTKLILELSGVGDDKDPEVTRHVSYFTAIDSDGTPVGISFMSVMILRNLARFANKHGGEFEKNGSKLMDRLFGGAMKDIWRVFSLNRTLRGWLGQLINMIEKGEIDEKRGTKRELEDGDNPT
jgi:chromatin structure-remodeling complex subunit RSC9